MTEKLVLELDSGLIDKGTEVPEPNKWRQMGDSLRAKGIAMTIPMVMVAGPFGGALIGRYLASRLEMPWLLPLCLLLGIAASVLESINLIRQLNAGKKR